MNNNISRLVNISSKATRNIIGLMSGTSLDGLDIALCEISGSGNYTTISLKKFATINYDDDFRKEIRQVFSQKNVELEKLCLLNEWIGTTHATLINDCLKNWNISKENIDLIASHGQTIYHAPKRMHDHDKFGNATLQIGDGDHIAVVTGIITVSDFRQKHIAAGGEGAPLASYGDYLVFSRAGEDRILLNIGGIANFTWLPGSMNISEVFSTDTGTGNTLMDALMQKHFPGKHFDENAAVAKQGTVNGKLLDALKKNHFFSQQFPKTTGPELFNLDYLQKAKEESGTTSLSVEDSMSTLNRFTAETIASAVQKCLPGKKNIKIFSSGGGMHNPLLMQHLEDILTDHTFHTTESLGINPDAKEAVLFALLANECICGDASVFGKANKTMPAVTMGKISFPS